MTTPFVLDNCEQLNITPAQAAILETAGLIYKPEPETSPHYYTTAPDVSLDEVELALLRGIAREDA